MFGAAWTGLISFDMYQYYTTGRSYFANANNANSSESASLRSNTTIHNNTVNQYGAVNSNTCGCPYNSDSDSDDSGIA
jgi:hypothetical protein